MNRENVLEMVRDAHDRGVTLDLHGADLREADLRWSSLFGADLHEADLNWADLRWADLHGANLREADLNWADLSGASWDGLVIDGLHQYRCVLLPPPTGWKIVIGCWSGTVDELRSLISRDDGWPEATGEQIAQRRPRLEAFCDMCDTHIGTHQNTTNGQGT